MVYDQLHNTILTKLSQAEERLSFEEKTEAWTATACILALSTRNNLTSIELCRLIAPHVQACTRRDFTSSLCQLRGRDAVVLLTRLLFVFVSSYDHDTVKHQQILENIRTQASIEFSQEELLHIDRNEAVWCLAQGSPQRAVQLLENVLGKQPQNLPATSHQVLLTEVYYARSLIATSQWRRAVDILERVVEVQSQERNETDEVLLDLKFELATALRMTGFDVSRAVELLDQVVAARERTYPETDASNIVAKYELAMALKKERADVPRAIKMLEQVVVASAALPAANPDRFSAEHELAVTLIQEGLDTERGKILLEHLGDVKSECHT